MEHGDECNICNIQQNRKKHSTEKIVKISPTLISISSNERLYRKHRQLLLANNLVTFGPSDRIEELTVHHHSDRTSQHASQDNIHKVMSVVLNPRQSHVECQKERSECEQVPIDRVSRDVTQKLKLTEKPHGQEQECRKRNGQVTRGSRPHSIHKCPISQWCSAYVNAHKGIKWSCCNGPTASQEIGPRTSHPILQDISHNSIDANCQKRPQKRHLENMPCVILLVSVLDESHHCHHHQWHRGRQDKTHRPRDPFHHRKRMLNGWVTQFELTIERSGPFSNKKKKHEENTHTEPVRNVAPKLLQPEVRG